MNKMIEDEEDGEAMIFKVPLEGGGRLDKVLAGLAEGLSRSRLQALIEEGAVMVNDVPPAAGSMKVKPGDLLSVLIPPLVDATPQAENIPLDIVYEDNDLLVINKAAGMVVHPGAGNWSGTLVNALLHHCRDSLSGIGGVMRPGIVHRLDKETSGLMIVAKNDKAHKGLSSQLADRTLSRSYHAIVWRVPNIVKGKVDLPIGRHPTNRLKMAIRPANAQGAREAITHYHREDSVRDVISLLRCDLETGRTHQIRVHMQQLGHPLIGDPFYGLPAQEQRGLLKRARAEDEVIEAVLAFPRQALHAAEIHFIHPGTDEEMSFEHDWPEDMQTLYSEIKTIG